MVYKPCGVGVLNFNQTYITGHETSVQKKHQNNECCGQSVTVVAV